MAGSSSFQYDKGNSFFAVEEDVDDAEFLKPATKNSSYSSSTLSERRQQLLQEKEKIEQRTIQSSLRSIALLNDSEEVGIQTAEELSRQREQLQNTEQKLDEINSALRISQRHLQGIKSIFGGIKNYFTAPPKQHQTVQENKEEKSEDTSNVEERVGPVSSSNTSNRPSVRTQTTMPRDRSTDAILDDNFDIMGASLTRLKGLGLSLHTEIEDQNSLVERIIGKTEHVDHRIQQQNQQMNKILKK